MQELPINIKKINLGNSDDFVREVYSQNVDAIYKIVSFFISQPAVESVHLAIAQKISRNLKGSGYRKYAKLICFQTLFEHLQKQAARISNTHSILRFEEYFTLLLRDYFGFSCIELAAICETADGSVRTRLKKSREKLFPELWQSMTGSKRTQRNSKSETVAKHSERVHNCLLTQQSIEDNIITTPDNIEVSACSDCSGFLALKQASVKNLENQTFLNTPEKLRIIPENSVFIKESSGFFLNWSLVPWYVKALLEGLLATALVSVVVFSVPKAKRLYEYWLEKRMDVYAPPDLAINLTQTSEDEVREPDALPISPTEGSDNNNASAKLADINGKNEKLTIKPETEFGGKEEKASSDKIYRLFIKTDSPESLKDSVMKILRNISYEASTSDGMAGTALPGGIMFDIFIPLKDYKYIANSVAKLGDSKFIITRSKEKNRAGKAHFKIWLQRI